ncbi:MAG: AraC family transcriptional regulator [Cyanobacteria bacterium J06560_5]
MTDKRNMAIALADFKGLWDIAYQKDKWLYRKTDFAVKTLFPHTLGKGGHRRIYLRNGLEIFVRNGKVRQPIVVDHQHGSDFPLIAKFYISGFSRVKTKGPALVQVEADYAEVAGHHYLYYLPDVAEIEEWPADECCQVVSIIMRLDYLRSFHAGSIPPASPLKQLLENRKTQPFHRCLGRMTPAMHQILQQILFPPYQGMMEHLHLESKALELLLLQFATLSNNESPAGSLKVEDMERVQYARDLLVQQVCNPPSLTELAQLSGLNEFKLKQGFRHLFDTTVFGYLYDYRMKQAEYLLCSTRMNVAEVSAKVGYGSPEAFSTAFRRKFSLSPKAFQLEQRR